MPIPWTLLKALSYPGTAIVSAGSGALAMYFAKPDVDLEPENKKWNEEMNDLRVEMDKAQQEAKDIAKKGQSQLDTAKKSVNVQINSKLKLYAAEVNKYGDCLDGLFKEIIHVDKISWFSRLYYTDKERVERCGARPSYDSHKIK